MRKWIIIVLIILIIIGWRGFSIYRTALEPVEEAQEKANAIALEKTDLETVNESYTYYGTSAFQVIIGRNKDDKEMIVWIPEKGGEIITRFLNEGITKKEAISIVNKERNPKQIRSVKLGIEDNIPIWEIVYIANDNRLTYHKLYFETGKYRNTIKP